MKFTENIGSGRRGKLGLPFGKEKSRSHNARRMVNIREQFFEDTEMGRNAEDFFKRDMSSESRDEDDGFFEYESLSSFHLPRPETPIDIVITVQAATISSKRAKGNAQVIDNLRVDLTSGHAIVGVVREIGSDVEDIQIGDRVATVVENMTRNSRYARVSASRTVKVPCGVDSAEAASCAYSFLMAFQSINHGIPLKQRYNEKPLLGQSILVVDGIGVTGMATIRLAMYAGAEEVYAIGDVSHHKFIESCGAMPLNPNDWLRFVENKIDLVIDSVQADHHKQFEATKALKPTGKLVCVGTPITTNGRILRQFSCKPVIKDFIAQINLLFVEQKKATFYDLFSNLYHYPEMMKVNLLEVLIVTVIFSISFIFSPLITPILYLL